MKNNQTNLEISTLAAEGTPLDFAIAEARGLVTVKKLRTRGPRKGELITAPQGGGRVMGSDHQRPVIGTHAAMAGGSRMTFAPQGGQGREMVSNLTVVQANYQKMLRSDSARADRAQEAANRRAERAATTQDALDALLATI